MSQGNPNISTPVTPNLSVNSLIEQALANQTINTPSSSKRKSNNQLSGEKDKPSKILHSSTATTEPTKMNQIPPSLSLPAEMPKPRMIRQDNKNLGPLPCVAAYYTMEAILTKDAIHPAPRHVQPSFNDIRNKISDHILENKHNLIDLLDKLLKDAMIKTLDEKDENNQKFFDTDSKAMTEISNAAFEIFLINCDNNQDLKKQGTEHYDQAKKSLASEMSAKIPNMLNKFKDDLTPFLTLASRNSVPNKDLCALIIRGANFENKWLSIFHDSMPTSKSGTSTCTLATNIQNLQNDTEHHQTEIIEIENQLTKISVRMGDLKTSELSNRYQQVENIVRLHNINTIDDGTTNHFRTLNHPEKVKRIHNLVSEHISAEHGFSTQVITPKNNSSKQFEPLAIITFSNVSAKYKFEKSFAEYRRKTPSIKVTTSRPAPQKTDLTETCLTKKR